MRHAMLDLYHFGNYKNDYAFEMTREKKTHEIALAPLGGAQTEGWIVIIQMTNGRGSLRKRLRQQNPSSNC